MSRGGYSNEADFTEISQILRNPGQTEHVQTVCSRFFFSSLTYEIEENEEVEVI